MKLINMNLGDMSLIEMSFAAAVMILAIIVVRALAINKLPKKVFLLLWDVVLLRLLIPFSIPSVFSAYTFVKKSEPIREVITQAPTAGMMTQMTGTPVNAGISSEVTVPSDVQSIKYMITVWKDKEKRKRLQFAAFYRLSVYIVNLSAFFKILFKKMF